MQALDSLIRDARALAEGAPTADEAEVARQLTICNACRYCEGFCAVFPAMTRRLEFGRADVHFLANLCHNCGACLHACQYAPPHEFALALPRAMAKVRASTYETFAWPPALGGVYRRNGLGLALALVALFTGLLGLAAASNASGTGRPGDFYAVFPHHTLVALFAPIFGFVVLALAMGVRRFWREVLPATGGVPVPAPAAAEATHDALRLRYLDGGHGDGCHEADDAPTHERRRAHHLTFYGFLLCFAATSVATVWHYVFGWTAPYDLPSLPKLLGAAGGVALTVGTVGLWRLNGRRPALHGDPAQRPIDRGFIALLFLVATSGLALWLARGAAPMTPLLCLHLGAVMALFVTMPYGKFAHGVYRLASLLRHATERRLPSPIGLGSD